MSLSKLLKTAKTALSNMENGKSFPTSYVANRLESSAQRNPSDQLVGNMRDVITKIASKQQFISQKEISDLYNKMYGFSNGNSAFRTELSDLLPENYAALKPSQKAHFSKRANEEDALVSCSDKNELTDAFSRMFSLDAKKAFGTYDKNLVKRAEKLVTLELSSVGLAPQSIQVVGGNEHFILCTASYKNSDFTTSTLKIPVQISNGSLTPPSSFISGESLEKISKDNILVSLKEQSLTKKATGRYDFEEQRSSYRVSDYSPVTPSALNDMIDVENVLVQSTSKFSQTQIQKAAKVVSSEVSSFGVFNPQVKLASSSDRGLGFSVKIATTNGVEEIVVPVEITGDRVNIPSRFVSLDKKSYDFSTDGFEKFIKEAKVVVDKTTPFFRDTDQLEKLSYSQLMDKITTAVSISDYKLAEDSLSVVASKFGPEKFKVALEDFQSLIKSASKTKENDIMVKEALRKGDLIKRANSIELYCPKLGLPLSKIDFDKNGKPIPKHRSKASQMESIENVGFTTSKIFFN
jgi:hypothetical protein